MPPDHPNQSAYRRHYDYMRGALDGLPVPMVTRRIYVALHAWNEGQSEYEAAKMDACLGLDVIKSALDDITEEILNAGHLTLTDPEGEELEFDEGSCLDDREIERMVVSARIIGYTPPTLNEVRARNGAAPVEDGDRPCDHDAEAEERRAAKRLAQSTAR
jgi:hypothetical protein